MCVCVWNEYNVVQYAFPHREHHQSPGYYDGRYWTMWKLPMFGCTDASQVIAELQEAKKAYPHAHIRIIGFDNVRQVQCISFIAYIPPKPWITSFLKYQPSWFVFCWIPPFVFFLYGTIKRSSYMLLVTVYRISTGNKHWMRYIVLYMNNYLLA